MTAAVKLRAAHPAFLHDDEGAALVELAVTLSLFFLMLSGIANFGFLIEQKVQLQEAAAAGAAFGTIYGNRSNTSGITSAAKSSAPVLSSKMTVSATTVYSCSPNSATVSAVATCPDNGTPLMFVQVTTSSTLPAVLKYVGMQTNYTMQGFASYEVPW